MKNFLLASVSAFVLAGGAQGADLPVAYKAPPLVIPSWTGLYVGINGGVTWQDGSFNDPDGCCVLAGRGSPATYDVSTTGGIFGGYAGYNWQQQSFVYGVEADIDWVGAKATAVWGPGAPNGGGATYQQSQDIRWLATILARAGIDIELTLFYLTGGLAVAQVNNSFNVFCGGNVCLPQASAGTLVDTFSESKTQFGWTAGAGFEHMFDSHWTLRGEFRYVDLGSTSVSCNVVVPTARFCSTAGASYRGEFSNTLMTGLVGVAYKF